MSVLTQFSLQFTNIWVRFCVRAWNIILNYYKRSFPKEKRVFFHNFNGIPNWWHPFCFQKQSYREQENISCSRIFVIPFPLFIYFTYSKYVKYGIKRLKGWQMETYKLENHVNKIATTEIFMSSMMITIYMPFETEFCTE